MTPSEQVYHHLDTMGYVLKYNKVISWLDGTIAALRVDCGRIKEDCYTTR